MKNLKIKIYLLAIIIIAISCSRMFDNIEKYVESDIIYTENLDGIIRVQVGFERVEIDLMKAGRIPSSQIKMAKATKTVIECEDFTEPEHRRVIDSVCSWVNVTGLKQLKNYRLTIYTEDKHGNRSLPLVADVRPYTAENLTTLEMGLPSVVEASSSASLEWKDRLSTITYTVYSYTWCYTDRNGAEHTGGGKGDMPSLFVENVEKTKDIPVSFSFRTIPTLSNFDGTYTPILDTVNWQTTYNLRISENAEAAIFLKEPANLASIDMGEADVFPVTFSWTKNNDINRYVLKFSLDRNFPAEATYTVDVGDTGEYITDMVSLGNYFKRVHEHEIWWTVSPAEHTISVNTQTRRVYTKRKLGPTIIDVSTFTSVNANVVYSKLAFDKGGKIIIQGMSATQFEREYNRDFFIKNIEDGNYYFDGADGEWEIYYSERYQYFYVLRSADKRPDGLWGIGSGFNSAPVWHDDFNASNWDFNAFWRLTYFRKLDNGWFQASVYLGAPVLNCSVEIWPHRSWDPTIISALSITGDIEGIAIDGDGVRVRHNVNSSFVPGYYLLTYDALDTRELNFKRLE